jgi:hypothetical protein
VAVVFTGVAIGRNSEEEASTVTRLIEEAGQARSEGDVRLANMLLRDAISIDPDNVKAHWQLGNVKVGEEWLSIEESQSRAAADPRQAKYRARKRAANDTPADELELARWCRRSDLDEEALVHWTRVLSANPDNREALRAVKLRWHDGQLMAPGDRRTARQEDAAAAQSLRRWSSTVAVWMRALSDRYGMPPAEVIDEIQSVTDVAAIPAVERVTLIVEPSLIRGPAPQRLSVAFVNALRDMPEVEATNSLLRYAVVSPFDEVRSAATRELKYRPLSDVVPTLLEGLAAPIDISVRVDTGIDGSVTYRQNIYQQGPLADRLHSTTRSIVPPGSPFAELVNQAAADAVMQSWGATSSSDPFRAVSNAGAQRAARSYENEIVKNEQQARAVNEKLAAMNERIVAVLTSVTDQSFGNNPRQWWDWWQDYTDYDRSRERPIYETREESGVYVRPERPAYECFVRGTPVWTKTGRRPIESLAVGDLVLSQNVNSGEIAYKPVLLRTLRQAGPVVEIATSKEKFRSTRGHPLWVDGAGWRMAKELEAGANLHALAGQPCVESVEPATNAETYNLVVADFNTYFIGTNGVLVHDNTPRRPTRCIVPGLVAK